MAKEPNIETKIDTAEERSDKRALQRQIGRTRESISDTVDEIKETAEQGYASVKETVSGVLDYRDEFQKEPLVWSLGALSAGFGLGYAVGYAHKFATKKSKNSQVAQFTDRMVDELSKVGQSLVVPALGSKIREFFGFDFTELLEDMRGKKQRSRKKATRTRRPKASARGRKSKKS
jgi:hypothetical protein